MIIFTFYNNVHVYEFGNYPLTTKSLMSLITKVSVLAITSTLLIYKINEVLSLLGMIHFFVILWHY